MKTLPKTKLDSLSFYFITVSLLGLCLLAMLTFNIPISTIKSPWQKQLISSIFGVICFIGLIAGVSPTRCSQILHFKKTQDKNAQETGRTDLEEKKMRLMGHHPTCGRFSGHVIQTGNKVYCAGCTGLIVGAVVSLLGIFLYVLFDLSFEEIEASIFWLGFILVALGLLQYNLFALNRGSVHLSLNVIFVLGTFLLLIGVNEITGNLAIGSYLLTLIIYWISARIMLSKQGHKKICGTCNLNFCPIRS